ncbi:hypothetical protein N7478_008667 [Penicillium angulare]|uniref:uncharacterized protein n=1 Tax=Penicillium angulare TaxID=116970 RepID=UPI00254145FE|nr:uncharacterized protein N7478_008667 [Penicillium angulare]KAJ5273542.1 hypothetical protein N7478_008667 [Penicillium angulare]
MPPRRSHQKSHTGCLTCKRRHVKCDETGPPCKRCETRSTICEYPHLNLDPQSLSAHTPEEAGRTTETTLDSHPICPSFPTNRHHLDLQLMHRWTASTYKSCCTPGSGDEALWQLIVPALALEYDFLLHGLLALSAFECASILKKHDRESPSYQEYIKSALEYQVLALASFRAQITSDQCENQRAALCFSLMLMVLAFASVRFKQHASSDDEESVLQTTIVHFELVRGAVQVATGKEDLIRQNEYVQNLVSFQDLPSTLLDSSIAEIILDLVDMNDKRIVETVQEIQEERIRQIAFWEACKKALSLLQECFQKCVGPVYRGYALGWLNMAGEGYINALNANDHISRVILMVWGILVERLGDDVWWAQQYGTSLIKELSNDELNNTTDPSIRTTIRRILEFIETMACDREHQ